MSAFFSSIIATFITLPILGYLIVFIISKQITKHHRRSVKIALDASTILFILSVHFLIIVIWQKSFLWMILLGLISVAIIVVVLNWKLKEEIDFTRVFRGFWRFTFMIFFSIYIVLICIGLFKSISSSML
ncbi:DUF3397 domain-containing protein [Bacillus sp. 31A1R]|uniref:DUF3397 domain-containing protein n=1 Tax=Robertmurraya mangrovi TaxID=3098077 RepID=A0ABU5IU66_9BACI|nr:DUF3397 domain-containing protein [Bacillus sp. 31A1R]MDZ5470690.1 DUF3397 domain-containing protein [Bacillus sp. 31A1R]